jgi:hypothetical protein
MFTGQLQEKMPCQTSVANDDRDDSNKEIENSGGETEGSEYDVSVEDEIKRKKKKRRTSLNTSSASSGSTLPSNVVKNLVTWSK